jgi:hypothetical protein
MPVALQVFRLLFLNGNFQNVFSGPVFSKHVAQLHVAQLHVAQLHVAQFHVAQLTELNILLLATFNDHPQSK